MTSQLRVSKVMLDELYRIHTSDRLAQTRLPILVIVGSRDAITPASSIRRGYEQWGGPKSFVELTESHHLPFVDEPKRFTDAVLGFARSVGSAR